MVVIFANQAYCSHQVACPALQDDLCVVPFLTILGNRVVTNGVCLPIKSVVSPRVFLSIGIVLQNKASELKVGSIVNMVRKISPKLCDSFPLAAFFMFLCCLGPARKFALCSSLVFHLLEHL